MGRPALPIDGEQVFKLAKLGCTQQEIADVFNCDHSVISRRFAQEYSRARGVWKKSLRRAQTIRAIKDRSDSMLIHLGKTYLGQTDRIDVTSDGKPVQPIFRRVSNGRDGDQGLRSPAEANGVCDE